MKIILASTSIRRRELLSELKIDFTIKEPVCDEDLDFHTNPKEKVENLSYIKAKSVFNKEEDSLVIGADTVVVFENEIFGKPKDLEEAKKMLSTLSGKTHSVITGITFITKNKSITESVVSKVKFKNLTKNDIEEYVNHFNVLDKAGSYAIQDGQVVESFEGSYSNVVGLPMERTKEILKESELWLGIE